MPFGLCNAPATFQRLMQVVLSGLEWDSRFVYLDDILISLHHTRGAPSAPWRSVHAVATGWLALETKEVSSIARRVVLPGARCVSVGHQT